MRRLLQTAVVLGILLGNVGAAWAQTFRGYVTGGAIASQLDGDALAGYNRLGLLGGVGVWYDLSDKWRSSLAFAYAPNGSRANGRESQRTSGPGTFSEIKLNYVAVPVHLHYMDWLSDDEVYYRLEFVAGIEYRRLISTETLNGVGVDISDAFNYRPNGLGFNLGAYYSLRERTAIGAFHRWGILNANERTGTPLLSKQLSLSLRQAF